MTLGTGVGKRQAEKRNCVQYVTKQVPLVGSCVRNDFTFPSDCARQPNLIIPILNFNNWPPCTSLRSMQQQLLLHPGQDIFTIIAASWYAVESDPFGVRYTKSMSDRHPRQQLTTVSTRRTTRAWRAEPHEERKIEKRGERNDVKTLPVDIIVHFHQRALYTVNEYTVAGIPFDF